MTFKAKNEEKNLRIEAFNQGLLFFSNSVESLFDHLKNAIFKEESSPFSQRLLLTPSQAMQQWVQIQLASSLSIASGIQTTFLNKGVEILARHLFDWEKEPFLPTELELTLRIEKELDILSLSDRRRIELAKHLAQLFLRYGVYANRAALDWEREPTGWQEHLWQKIFREWDYPQRVLLSLHEKTEPPPDLSVHLFAFSHISPLHFHFFQRVSHLVPVYFYQLSPCWEFWSDHGEGPPTLLANLGKVGRHMAKLVEESDLVTEECYRLPEGKTQLKRLQKDLLEMHPTERIEEDDSIQIHSSLTPYEEVKNLHTALLTFLSENRELEPKDILVMAPKITLYAPYIEAVFGDVLDYQIADIPIQKGSPHVEGLFLLLELDQKRWSAPAVLELFSHPLFCKQQGLNEEDLLQLRKWVKETGICWGLDAPHRDALLKQAHCHKGMDDSTATWQEGIDHLLEELAIPYVPSRIDFTEAELLGNVISVLQSLRTDLEGLKQKQSAREWVEYLKTLSEKYFAPTEEVKPLLMGLERLAKAGRHVPERVYDFVTIRSLLKEWLGQENTTIHRNRLQAVRFCSMLPMRAIPAKVLCLLGMNHDAFPRQEELQSLDLLVENRKSDYSPTRIDFDRYLFLEALLSAREKLFISYVGRDPYDLTELPPSSVVSELLPFVSKKQIVTHSIEQKQREKICFSVAAPPPSIPESEEMIDVSDLLRLARSPLQHYLYHHGLKIREEEELQTEEPFTLSPLKKAILRKKVMHQQPLKMGDFPTGMFGTVANLQLQEEISKLPKLHLETFEISPFDFKLSDGVKVKIAGSLEGVFQEGLCVIDRGNLKGGVRAWPLFLLLNMLDGTKKSLLFATTNERKECFFNDATPFFRTYLEYYFLAKQQPVPLFPDWITPLFNNKLDDLKTYDHTLEWVLRGKEISNIKEWTAKWTSWMEKLYGEMRDAWF